MGVCKGILCSVLGACVVPLQASNISVSAVQVADLVFSKEAYFKQDFDFEKCKQMMSKLKDNQKLFERAQNLGLNLFYGEEQNFNDTLVKLFDSSKELTSSTIGEHTHRSPKLVRCALCLIGLNNCGSNFDDCLDKYKKLVNVMEEVYNVRNGRKAAVIAAFVFCQRLGYSDVIGSDVQVKKDVDRNKLQVNIVKSNSETFLSIMLAMSVVVNVAMGVALVRNFSKHDSKSQVDERSSFRNNRYMLNSNRLKRWNGRRPSII